MKNDVLKNLTLTVIFDDGKEIRCPYSLEAGCFDYDLAEFDPAHDVKKMLRVVEVTEEGRVILSYIHDGDYEPRKMLVDTGKSIEIVDHMVVRVPDYGKEYQRVLLVIEN